MHHRQAPGFVEPMLLATDRDLPCDAGWWAELKLDGARGQLRVIDGEPALRTRRGRRCDAEFPEVLAAAAGLPDVILDGEIVLFGDDGAPDFAALRTRLGANPVRARAAATTRPAVFCAFDVILHEGRDLRGYRLVDRRRILESLSLSGAVALVDTHPGQAAAVLAFAREHFLEGVVVKQADSLYRSGRSTVWQKFKIRHPERVWVTAWLPGGPGELDRYWVGRPVNGALVPSGEVSYGLTPGQASALRRVLHAADLGARGSRPSGRRKHGCCRWRLQQRNDRPSAPPASAGPQLSYRTRMTAALATSQQTDRASRRGRSSQQSRTDGTGCGPPQLDAHVLADALSRDESADGGRSEQVHLPKIEADRIQAAAVEQRGQRSAQRSRGRDVEPAADDHLDLAGTDLVDTNLESTTANRRGLRVRRRGLRFRHRASLRYLNDYAPLTG